MGTGAIIDGWMDGLLILLLLLVVVLVSKEDVLLLLVYSSFILIIIVRIIINIMMNHFSFKVALLCRCCAKSSRTLPEQISESHWCASEILPSRNAASPNVTIIRLNSIIVDTSPTFVILSCKCDISNRSRASRKRLWRAW